MGEKKEENNDVRYQNLKTDYYQPNETETNNTNKIFIAPYKDGFGIK